MDRSRALGIAALFLLGLALIAVVVPIVSFVHARSGPGFVVTSTPQHVTLPAQTRYGIFFRDTYNRGYSESCVVTEEDGEPVDLREPDSFMATSPTNNLDLVFDTGSGHLVISCQSSADQVTARPVPRLLPLVGGFGLAALLAVLGIVLLAIRSFVRSSRPATITPSQ